MATDVPQLLANVFRNRADTHAIQFQGTWFTWGELAQIATQVQELLCHAGVPPEAPVGLVVRNQPMHAALILWLIAARRTVAMVHALQSPEAMARDLGKLRAMAVIALEGDWTLPTKTVSAEIGSIGILLRLKEGQAQMVDGLGQLGKGPFAPFPTTPGLQLLSSGTTGLPKRIHLPMNALSRGIATVTSLGKAEEEMEAPAILYWPLGNISVMSLVAQSCLGRPMVLLERFLLDEFLEAIQQHRPSFVAMPPPVIRKILHAKVPREVLSSLEFVSGGSGPLEPSTQEQFETTYGIPILWRYGATEFAGTLASWSLPLRRQFPDSKRGSVGMVLPGIEVRIVDMETGAEMPPGQPGYLEGKVDMLGPEWIRSTDIARVDEDGFIFILGRGDGAIIRGGFKILPERVVECLRSHPKVGDAAVVGIPDPVLGEVPVAAIEGRPGVALPTTTELEEQIRSQLPAHHVPVDFRVVDNLPRTVSLKVDLSAVKSLFTSRVSTGPIAKGSG